MTGATLMTWLARICGLLIVVAVGIVLWMSGTQDFDPPPSIQPGLRSPILGVELVKSADEFRRLVREPLGGHNRAVYRGQILEDWYFIPSYSALFVGLVSLLAFRPSIGWRVLTLVVIAVMAGAAYCDFRENLGILALIGEAPRLVTDAMAVETRFYSRIKWGLIFVALAPVAIVFVVRRSSGIVSWLASLLAAILLFAGSIVGLAGASAFDPAISWGSILMGLGFGPAFFVLVLAPETLAFRRAPRRVVHRDDGAVEHRGDVGIRAIRRILRPMPAIPQPRPEPRPPGMSGRRSRLGDTRRDSVEACRQATDAELATLAGLDAVFYTSGCWDWRSGWLDIPSSTR